jgi:hypothetical protein
MEASVDVCKGLRTVLGPSTRIRRGDAGDPEAVDKRLISAVDDVSLEDLSFRGRTEIFLI